MGDETQKEVGLNYNNWMRWQVPVCAFIIVIPALVAINLIKNRKRETKNDDDDIYMDMWRPCWRNVDPKWLLVYRSMAFISMAYLLYKMLLFAGPFSFYFYTQWTFALVMLYFAIGIIISAQGCFMSSTFKTTKTNMSNHHKPTNQPCFFGNLMQIVYQTSAGASILTDLVFWCVLVPMMAGKEFQLTLLIGSIHTVNAVFLVIDSFLNALPFEWFGFNYFILWSVTYVTFQWILHACGSTWWPYPFLELSTPWAPLWYFGLALIHVPCYAVYILLVKAKNSVFSKLFPQAFVRSHKQGWCYKKAA